MSGSGCEGCCRLPQRHSVVMTPTSLRSFLMTMIHNHLRQINKVGVREWPRRRDLVAAVGVGRTHQRGSSIRDPNSKVEHARTPWERICVKSVDILDGCHDAELHVSQLRLRLSILRPSPYFEVLPPYLGPLEAKPAEANAGESHFDPHARESVFHASG